MTLMRNPAMTQEELKSILNYNSETGKFQWVSMKWKRSNRVGSKKSNGYMQVAIGGKVYYQHRLAWLYMTGEMPDSEIDHINGIRDDNRWCNLRLATSSQNGMNTALSSVNTSGVKGVSWDKRNKKWCATIKIDRRTIWLGRHLSIESAKKAIARARKRIHGEFACDGTRQENLG